MRETIETLCDYIKQYILIRSVIVPLLKYISTKSFIRIIDTSRFVYIEINSGSVQHQIY